MALFLFPLVASFSTIGTNAGSLLSILTLGAIVVAVWRWTMKMGKKFETFNTLVAHELNHNSGTSVKDKAYEAVSLATQALAEAKRAAEAADRAASGVETLSQQFTTFLLNDAANGGRHVIRDQDSLATQVTR